MILAFGIRLALTPGVAASSLPLPDYSGVWKLNRELSDDPAQALREMRGSGGGSSGWHGRGGHGRHGGGGGSGDGAGDSGGAPESSAFAALETLTIRHSEPDVTVVDGVGREHRFTTDGRKSEEERSRGGTTKVRAAWKDGRLEVVTVPEHGPKWTETYSITADRSQLTVTTKIEGSRGGSATVRRVYDAVPDPPAAPTQQTPGESDADSDTVSAR
jgi:hypothetical protein